MPYVVEALIAAGFVSAISVVVVFIFFWTNKKFERRLVYLLSLSAGGMIGSALFHLLPEAVEEAPDPMRVFVLTAIGFTIFFVLERLIHWHHCHDQSCSDHEPLGYVNLVGDAIHNFLDGIIMVTAFSIHTGLGVAVSLAVVFHEIPQEIGDYGVLLYAGFSKTKALAVNFLVALLAIVGVIVGYILLKSSIHVEPYLVPIAAGSFMYIAATDLIPEIHKHDRPREAWASLVIFCTALVFMYVLKVTLE